MKLKKLKRKHFWKRNEFPKLDSWSWDRPRTVWSLGRSKISADNRQVGNFSKVKDKVKNYSYKDTLLETFCSFPMGQLKGSGLLRTSSSSPSWIFESLVPVLIVIADVLAFKNPGRRGR